jgi:hypothetical protein
MEILKVRAENFGIAEDIIGEGPAGVEECQAVGLLHPGKISGGRLGGDP